MVMGCLGLLAAASIRRWRASPYNFKYVLSGLFAGVLLFLLLGLTPGTDILAHLGGFVTGVFLGTVLMRTQFVARMPRADFVAGVVFLVLVIVPWWRAVASGH